MSEFFTYCEETSDQKGFNGQLIMPTLICHPILMDTLSTENWYSGMPEELRTSTLRTSVGSRCDGNSDLRFIFLSNHRTALQSILHHSDRTAYKSTFNFKKEVSDLSFKRRSVQFL